MSDEYRPQPSPESAPRPPHPQASGGTYSGPDLESHRVPLPTSPAQSADDGRPVGGGTDTPGTSHPVDESGQSAYGSAPSSPYAYAAPVAGASAPADSAHSEQAQQTEPSKRGGKATLGQLAAVAGISALLASGLTSLAAWGLRGGGDGSNVSTGTTTVVNADPKDFADAGTVNWAATASKVTPSVVAITVGTGNTPTGEGSGVIIDSDGHIVTNNHVIAGSSRVQVTLSDNKSYEAKVVGKDPSTDLAVIKIDGVSGLKPIELGDDNKLVVGQPTMAVGNPLGLSGTVTTGIVSALDRPVSAGESSQKQQGADAVVTNAIQTSAAINPGNSGGALVDGSGRLIGINSSIASLSDGSGQQSGNIGIGFAIPTSVMKNISSQLIKSGKATHALLGLAATSDVVQQGSGALASARVREVSNGGAAQKAGIRNGDHIIAIDSEPVTSSSALVAQVRSRTPGSKVKLTIIRGGKAQAVEVTLGSK